MLLLFNKIYENIISNYILHEAITSDDEDPHRINNRTKQLIQEINNTYINYVLSNKNHNIVYKVTHLQNGLKILTESNGEKSSYFNKN